jgi:Type II secretion system (T2SS), protein M subtype b
MIGSGLAARLSDRERRTLMFGATAIAALVLLTKGVPAWHAWQRDAEAGAVELAADAARSDAAIAAYPMLRDSLRVRSARLQSLDSAIVAGADPSSAAASLATMVSDAATDAGVKLGAVQPRVDSEPHSLGANRAPTHQVFARVSVRGDVIGDVVALTQFLADLEHGPVLLAVRELSITQPEPAAPSSRMETLHADFTVVGLARAVEVKIRRDSGEKSKAPGSLSHPRQYSD